MMIGSPSSDLLVGRSVGLHPDLCVFKLIIVLQGPCLPVGLVCARFAARTAVIEQVETRVNLAAPHIAYNHAVATCSTTADLLTTSCPIHSCCRSDFLIVVSSDHPAIRNAHA